MVHSCKNHPIIRLATSFDPLEQFVLDSAITGLEAGRAREILESALADDECLVHVSSSNEIDGFVITNARAFFGRDFVKLLAVSSPQQRTGVGSALLRAAATSARTETIFSSTNESNVAMRALFEKEGWTLSGVLTGIDEGDPEMVFWHHGSGEWNERGSVAH